VKNILIHIEEQKGKRVETFTTIQGKVLKRLHMCSISHDFMLKQICKDMNCFTEFVRPYISCMIVV